MKDLKYWGALAALLIALAGAIVFWNIQNSSNSGVSARITLTQYPDTSLYVYGVRKGFFEQEGVSLKIIPTTWNEQIEFVAGGGADIAMATLDEIMAKAKNLKTIDREVVYFLPAWLFGGTFFASKSEILTYQEIVKTGSPDPVDAFLEQIVGKKIAVPDGGTYDQAIRRFIAKSKKYTDNDFVFINTKLEVGINGLEDPDVALAAAGAFEKLEVGRRGYKLALNSPDLDVVVLTGFIARKDFYLSNPQIISGFVRAWYKTVNDSLSNIDHAYTIVAPDLNKGGAKTVSLDEYHAQLYGNEFPTNLNEMQSLFMSESSPAYWKQAWKRGVEALKDSGRNDQIPDGYDAFVLSNGIGSITKKANKG
jgi:ABC-type nitrate/sulfonate/bicarbonate transport system substrate-binding protein